MIQLSDRLWFPPVEHASEEGLLAFGGGLATERLLLAYRSGIFPWYEAGKKEQTVAKLLWDDEHLYAAFICEDAHISAEHTERDSEVWKDDTVEVFTAPDPDHPQMYFNLEMNVLGIFLDQFHP